MMDFFFWLERVLDPSGDAKRPHNGIFRATNNSARRKKTRFYVPLIAKYDTRPRGNPSAPLGAHAGRSAAA